MTLVDIRHDAGPEHDKWAGRLREIAEEVVRVLPQITALPLPERVILRTVTPQEYAAAIRTHLDGVFQRERIRTAAGPETLPLVRAHHARMHELSAAIWVLRAAEAVETADGEPVILVLPESLRHTSKKHKPEAIYQLCAHEITHLMQYRAADGPDLWDLVSTGWRRHVHGRPVDWGTVLEGHARWVERLAMRRLLGDRADYEPEAQSAYYREVAEKYQVRVWHEFYGRAHAFVRRVIEVRGAGRHQSVVAGRRGMVAAGGGSGRPGRLPEPPRLRRGGPERHAGTGAGEHAVTTPDLPEIPRVPPRSPLTGPRSRLTDAGYRAFANALRAHYEKSGKSIRRLAAETGRAYASVHKVLGDAGTTFRPRGGKHERKR